MYKTYPLSAPRVVWSFDLIKDLFHPKEDNEHILGPEVPYLNGIGAFMYLT